MWEWEEIQTVLWEKRITLVLDIKERNIMNNWECPKCKNADYEKDQFHATGGNFAKIFDIQNKKFK